MSTTIDQRVVEMRFDNAQFERNISQSTESLEQLKKALQLDDAGRSFDNIEKAAKGFNLTSITEQVQTVKTSFSALESFADGVFKKLGLNVGATLSKIASDINSVSLFGQAKAGWTKNDQLTQATQTIVAAGYAMDQVESAMQRLNWYTDETSYDFTDMANNIGKFTAQNVDLETAATAMQGISNWAARSGQHVQEAGRAMYNLSQSLAQGSVKLIDWKSIENANMATAEFKQTVIDTALEMGTLRKAADGTYRTISKGTEVNVGTFSTTLSEAWFSSDVLLKTLEKYGAATNKLYEFSQRTGLTATELLSALTAYQDHTLDIEEFSKEAGMSVDNLTRYFEELSSEEYKLGIASLRAAQEALSLEQAIASVKDAASTGWMNIFKTIFGNYEESKGLWTTVAEDLYDIFVDPVNRLQKAVQGAFSSNYEKIEKELGDRGLDVDAFKSKIIELGLATGQLSEDMVDNGHLVGTSLSKLFTEGTLSADLVKMALLQLGETTTAVGGSADALKTYGDIVNEVIRGNFGNGQARIKALTEAGYDYASVQEKVNKVLRGQKLTMEDISEADLKALGITEDQINAWKQAAQEAGEAGTELNEYLAEITKPPGRVLFAEIIHNTLTGIINILGKLRDAWENAMEARGGTGLYQILEALHSGSEAFAKWTDETNIITKAIELLGKVCSFVGGVIKTVIWLAIETWNTLGEVIGKIVSKIYEWRETADSSGQSVQKLTTSLQPLSQKVKLTSQRVKDFITRLKQSQTAQSILEGIASFAAGVFKIISSVFGWFEEHLPGIIGWFQNIIGKVQAFFAAIKENKKVQKLWEKISKGVENLWETVKTKFGEITDTISNFFDQFSTDSDTAEGEFQSFKDTISGIVDKIMDLFDPNKDVEIDVANLLPKLNFNGWHSFSEMFAGLTSDTEEGANNLTTTLTYAGGLLKDFRKTAEGNVQPLEDSFGKITSKFTEFTEKLGTIELDKVLGALAGAAMMGIASTFSKAAQTIAGAFDKFGTAAVNFSKPANGISTFFDNLNKSMDQKKKLQTFKDIAKGIFIIAAAIGVLVAALYGISKLSESGDIWNSVGVLIVLSVILGALYYVVKKVNDKGFALDYAAIASLIAIPIALGLFVDSLNKLKDVDGKTILKILGIGAIFAALFAVLSLINDKLVVFDWSTIAGLLSIPLGLLIFAEALKAVASIDWEKSAEAIGNGVLMAIGVIFAITKMASKSVDWKAITSLLAIPVALIGFALAIEALSFVKLNLKALGNLVVALVVMLGIMRITRLAGEQAAKGGAAIAFVGIGLLGIAKAFEILMKMPFNKARFEDVADAVIKILGMFALITAATMLSGSDALKAGGAIMIMAGAMIAIAGAMIMMSLIEVDKIQPITAAIFLILIAFALIVAASGNVGKATGTIIAITFCLGLIVAAMAILSMIQDLHALEIATTCIGVLMGLFALVLAASNLAAGTDVLAILSLTFVLLTIITALYALQDIPGDQLLKSAGAIAIAMVTLVGALALLSLIPGGAEVILTSAFGLALAIAAIGAAAAVAGLGLAVLSWGADLAGKAFLSMATNVMAALLVVANGMAQLIPLGIQMAHDIAAGLIYGILTGIYDGLGLVIQSAFSLAKTLVDSVKDFLGIHSPSTVFAGIGLNTIGGLIGGVGEGLPFVEGAGGSIADTLIGAVTGKLGQNKGLFTDFLADIGDEGGSAFSFGLVESSSQGITDFNSYLLAGMTDNGVDQEYLESYATKYGEIFTDSLTEGTEEGLSDWSSMMEQYMSGSNLDYSNIEGLSVSFDSLNESISSLNQEGVANLTDSLTNLVTTTDDSLTSVLDKFDSVMPIMQINGQMMIESVITGVESKGNELDGTAEYIVIGLVSSIRIRLPSVFSIGMDIGNELLRGTMSALDVNSPSKEYARIGNYSIVGLINSVMSRLDGVRTAGYAIGDALLESTEESLTGYNGLLNSYTLSTVGVRSIQNGLGGLTVGANLSPVALNQLGSISADLNANAGENNVVAAITQLRSDVTMLGEAMSNMQVVMDSKTVVGTLSSGMDRSLGQRTVYKGRGN